MAQDGSGIGYNQGQIVEINNSLESGLNGLNEKMVSEYESLKKTFRENWIGVDEGAFEKSLADELLKAYENCDKTVQAAEIFLVDMGNAWAESQTQWAQQLNGSGVAQQLPAPQHTTSLPEFTIDDQEFSSNDDKGLTNSSAGENLSTAVENLIEQLRIALVNLYDRLDASKGFFGDEQAPAITGFVSELDSALANLIKNFIEPFQTETIPSLVQAYSGQESATAQSATEASGQINSQVQ